MHCISAFMLWLALHFPQLPLEAFTASSYIAGGQTAQIVLAQNRVHLANAAAISAGIVPGCSLATAHSIEPSLEHFRRDPNREATELQKLAESLYCFSSLVSLAPPDSIVLEIHGSLKLYTQADLLIATKELCQKLGFTCLVGTATTATAAITLARSQSRQLNDVALSHCGLEHQHIKHQVIEQLANMGLHTLGALLSLPRGEVAQRFGKELVFYLDKLEGKRREPRKAIQPAETFERKLHLLQPIANKQHLFEGPMSKLSLELQQWLIGHQLGCEKLTWRFVEHSTNASTLHVRFTQGKQHQLELLSVSQLQLDQATLPADVLSVELKLTSSTPWSAQSKDFFSATQDANSSGQNIGELVDALSARLGPQACQQIHDDSQHTPEHAWRFQAVLQPTRSTTVKPQTQASRPLWLLPRPHPVNAAELQLLQGPERIQSEWWLNSEARDYYIAQHSSGALCWVYCPCTIFNEPQSHEFYLHGYFA